MNVQLVYSPGPRQVLEVEVVLPFDGTVRQALSLSGWLNRFPEIQAEDVRLSIWGRLTTMGAALRDGDRLEVCRPLRVDPKVARRERFKGQGARGTGLFAQRRPGSKAGY